VKLYEFSWGSGTDERYSFLIDADKKSIIKIMSEFKEGGGDITDFDEFADFIYASCDFNIYRYYHEEPTYIHEDELTKDWFG